MAFCITQAEDQKSHQRAREGKLEVKSCQTRVNSAHENQGRGIAGIGGVLAGTGAVGLSHASANTLNGLFESQTSSGVAVDPLG